MTRQQFSAALTMARSGKDLSSFDDHVLVGFGLPGFKTVSVAIEVAAKAIRSDCITLPEEIDYDEIEICRELFLSRVEIIEV